jgi:hypothetical protein
MNRRAISLGILAFSLALVDACTGRGSVPIAIEPVSGDSLGPLLISRMNVHPQSIDVRLGQRIAVDFVRTRWADSSANVRFDRSFDVARLLWDSYGATHGIDTISIRSTTPGPGGSASSPARVEEFFFYPEQLAARQRPRWGSSR